MTQPSDADLIAIAQREADWCREHAATCRCHPMFADDVARLEGEAVAFTAIAARLAALTAAVPAEVVEAARRLRRVGNGEPDAAVYAGMGAPHHPDPRRIGDCYTADLLRVAGAYVAELVARGVLRAEEG